MSAPRRGRVSREGQACIRQKADGNGRTGRALLHQMLARDEVLMHATLPVSAGLLHNIDAYMEALESYHQGHVAPMVSQLLDALELAVVIGARIVVETACRRGILSKIGNAKRGAFYQASELIEILEEASSKEGIRLLAAR